MARQLDSDAVRRETDAMDAALVDGARTKMDAIAAILGVEPGEVLDRAVMERLEAGVRQALLWQLEKPQQGLGMTNRYVTAGFLQGVGFTAAALRVHERSLQPVLDKVYDMACEFDGTPDLALAAITEWIEQLVTPRG